MKLIKIMLVFAAIIVQNHAAIEVLISGKITDSKTSQAIAGAAVSLKSHASIKTESDANGAYTLAGTIASTSIAMHRSSDVSGLSQSVSIANNVLSAANAKQRVSLSILNLSGRTVHFISTGSRLDKSLKFQLPKMPKGTYILSVNNGSNAYQSKAMVSADGIWHAEFAGTGSSGINTEGFAKSAAAVDEIVVLKQGYATAYETIDSYSGTKDIALSPFVAGERVSDKLLALYTFKSGNGTIVKDVSGNGTPLDLTIKNNSKGEVSWITGGGLHFMPSVINSRSFENEMTAEVISSAAATKITSACKQSNQLSVEVWCKPLIRGSRGFFPGGPARIATISKDAGNRNVSFNIHGKSFDIRLRTTETTGNGLPAARNSDKSLMEEKPMHAVYSFSNPGAAIFINGKEVDVEFVDGEDPGVLGGTFSNWVDSYKLSIGDEQVHERAFVGDVYLVAYYSRPLSAAEVKQNYEAGY